MAKGNIPLLKSNFYKCTFEENYKQAEVYKDHPLFFSHLFNQMAEIFKNTVVSLEGYEGYLEANRLLIDNHNMGLNKQEVTRLNGIQEKNPKLKAILKFQEDMCDLAFHDHCYDIAVKALYLANNVLKNPSEKNIDELRKFSEQQGKLSFGDVLKGSILAFLGAICVATVIFIPVAIQCFKGAYNFFKTPLQNSSNEMINTLGNEIPLKTI